MSATGPPLEELHRERHDASHEDLDVLFRQVLGNPDLADRVTGSGWPAPWSGHGRARADRRRVRRLSPESWGLS